MTHHAHNDENVLVQLKAQTATYIELPFNTGDFLLIAHYKLIAHYRQTLNLMADNDPDQSLLADHVHKRRDLEEEVLFQLDKVLALSLLNEEQLEKLRSFKAMHEQLLQN